MSAPTIKVWDPLVRVLHWGVAACFLVAWLTADEWDSVHQVAGYVIAGLVGIRVLWGLTGPKYARFAQFVRSPKTSLRFLGQMIRGREPRYIGHNPAGGLMIVGLLVALAATALTGWATTLGTFRGDGWISEFHEFLASLLLIMVVLHVAGVLFGSMRHEENLAHAMIVGRKRAPEVSDVV